MKRKVLCIVLALMMCMLVALPAFADNDEKVEPERAGITASYGLTQVSGSTYKMWAKINNLTGATVSATLTLYDAAHNYITSISTTSSNLLISLSKKLFLSSATYYLRLSYTADGASYAFEKTYSI